MTKEKELLLNHTVDKVYNIGFGLESDEFLEDYFAAQVMVLGTATDERFFSLEGVRTLLRRQKEQSQGINLCFERRKVYSSLAADEKVAVNVEDVLATIKVNNEAIHFEIRSSAIFEYSNEQWKLIHWHASKPDQVLSDIDTFGIEQWKEKTAALEQLVAERTADLIVKNDELKAAIENLKATQAQLVQSEKMASLGELTAGIAHEIQNPLNFVNNFAEINMELIEELKSQKSKVTTGQAEALEIELIDDIAQNSAKINHHGKRADAIVKGMLQHSRSSSGHKEPTDINALADEYLRLSYHGFRAKDKSFNAILKTGFDAGIGHVTIIPQDMGRVILNLITNAFYAVGERSKAGAAGYEPTVTLSTGSLTAPSGGRSVEIKVADNGNGIPQKILEKIFQPFFTTKPTGQGTGLGLSLAWDIVKAHGGTMEVESKEGEGTKMTIILPVNQP